MKRFLLLTVLFASAVSVIGQVRSESDIKKMLKKGSACSRVLLYEDNSGWNNMAQSKEVTLKNSIDGFEPNKIEKALLENFDDVRISDGLPYAYFVFAGSCVGLYDLEGNIVVPPIEGYPRTITGTKRLYWGDTMPMTDWNTYITNARGKARRAYAGSFAAVIDKKTLKPVIPFGKYDAIHFTMKGMSTFYYVSKMDSVGLKWGVCDKTGNEIVPCEYNYVGLNNGTFEGDNSKNMEHEMAALNVILKRRQYNKEHRWERIGEAIVNVATAVGDAIVSADEFLRESGTYDAINSLASYYGSSVSNNYSSNQNTSSNNGSSKTSSSSHHPTSDGASMSGIDQQNYIELRKTYRKWADDLVAMKNHNGKFQNGYTENEKRHAQEAMKRISNMAKEKWGKEIPYDPIEDW